MINWLLSWRQSLSQTSKSKLVSSIIQIKKFSQVFKTLIIDCIWGQWMAGHKPWHSLNYIARAFLKGRNKQKNSDYLYKHNHYQNKHIFSLYRYSTSYKHKKFP